MATQRQGKRKRGRNETADRCEIRPYPSGISGTLGRIDRRLGGHRGLDVTRLRRSGERRQEALGGDTRSSSQCRTLTVAGSSPQCFTTSYR